MAIINREVAIAKFETFLASGISEWLLVFYGLNGLGKTTLLKHLHQHLQPEWAAVWLDFDLKSLRDYPKPILKRLEDALRSHNLSPEAWVAYEREKDKIAAWADRDRLVISQEIVATGGAAISNPTQTMIVHMEEGLARIELEAARAQTQAWLKLAEHLDVPLVIFIDHWDSLIQRGTTDFRAWLAQDLLLVAHQKLPGLRIVVAGDQPLQEPGLDDGTINIELSPLSLKYARQLMQTGGLATANLQEAIFNRTGGNPLLLNLAVTLWQETPSPDLTGLVQGLSVRAASEWLLGRISERLVDPRSQLVLERGVVLVSWTRDVLAAVCEDDELDLSWYKDFIAYPFIQDVPGQPGFKTFIRTVREIQISQLWYNHRQLFYKTHANALKWYTSQISFEALYGLET